MNQPVADNGALDALARQVRSDIEMLRYPDEPWVVPCSHPSGKHVFDVVVIGGGQGGLAITSMLKRERVTNIVAFDRQPEGFEGPWLTTARMRTLRTLKHLPGIDPTLASLSPQAWYIARYGAEAWDKLGKIPKEDWQDYLAWCRKTLDLPVHNKVEVTSVEPEGDIFRLDLKHGDKAQAAKFGEFVYTRRVVLATGIEGGGAWNIPPFIEAALPRNRYALASEEIDFSKLKGKRVAVLGAGASAFDNASTALEAGAREATVCIRRKDIQRINPQMWMGKVGFLRHFADLDDHEKWRFMRHMFRYNIPAPQDAYNRLSALPGASLRQNAGWEAVRLVDGAGEQEIEITLSSGDRIRADFLIVAIGLVVDFKLRPELRHISEHIALWQDRYTPSDDDADAQIATYPYQGGNFEFLEKRPGEAPYLARIFNFNFSAFASMGLSGSAISGLKYSLGRLVHGITRSLMREDVEKIYEAFTSYSAPEMTGEAPFSNPAAGSRSNGAKEGAEPKGFEVPAR